MKLGHPGQGIYQRFWWNMPSIENFVKLKVYKIPERKQKRQVCGKGNPSQAETTKVWAPTKRWQDRLLAILRQKYEIFRFEKVPVD